MRAISFGWTTPPLLAGVKTVTRRTWKPQYAERFHEGDRLWALNKDYRYGGQRIAVIRLTAEPAFEPPSAAPDSDYEAEGFGWFEREPHMIPRALREKARRAVGARGWQSFRVSDWFRSFLAADEPMWTVRFEVQEWLVDPESELARLEALVKEGEDD